MYTEKYDYFSRPALKKNSTQKPLRIGIYLQKLFYTVNQEPWSFYTFWIQTLKLFLHVMICRVCSAFDYKSGAQDPLGHFYSLDSDIEPVFIRDDMQCMFSF